MFIGATAFLTMTTCKIQMQVHAKTAEEEARLRGYLARTALLSHLDARSATKKHMATQILGCH
jgi:hypothetical protein